MSQSDNRWQLIKSLLNRALQLEPHERASYLADACADRDSVREELESLLKHADVSESKGFLNDAAAMRISEELNLPFS